MKRRALVAVILASVLSLGAIALFYGEIPSPVSKLFSKNLTGRFSPCKPAHSYLEDISSVDQVYDRENGMPLTEWASKDLSRFIAHAGGALYGIRYTNSLEALEESYQLGFRLFELDIIETSENGYVAAHDWESWKKGSGYTGKLPPSRIEFKEHKIYGRFTPLDMADINAWFGSHRDAILVTDKVNRPLEFSKLFIDKDRLMMELFSLNAVKEGINSGIRSAMPNWSVLDKLGCDKIGALKQLGITDIAASRRILPENGELLRLLKSAGIRVYAYQLNSESWDNEEYVICEEMDYFYGIYADGWDFDLMPVCQAN